MVVEDMRLLRDTYRIPSDIELLLPDPNERACFPRMGCTALNLNAFRDCGSASIYLPSTASDPKIQVHPESAPLFVQGLMTMDKEKRPRPALAHLNKQKPRALAVDSSEEARQKKVLEDMSREENNEVVEASKVIEVDDSSAPEGDVPLSRKRKSRASRSGAPQGSVENVDNYATCSASPLQRTLAVNTLGEVVLEGPPRLSQKSRGTEGGPYESKRQLRELIGAPGARIPDDVLRNVPFYPSIGAQAVKKYFTPKWEEFSSHGELEDVLEASLASTIRASAMQMKAALDSARMAYEQMEADLKESDSNVLNLTKQLDNANAAQKVAAEAFEAANQEKRPLLDEVQNLRGDLESSENGRKEAESGVARLMGEKKDMEEKLGESESKIGKCGGGVCSELT
ncbi:hypothetical protein Adt_35060 [Abeliophyllum distichum]|uniref:Uncharacterized protein n=1 Tax=Abeliophyllum distichum TaxID=126358 RepID=A0ABD1QH27_9LAMI